jgi:hypothetical protein
MSSPPPVPIFINRTQHFWVITNLVSVMRSRSWSSVFISTSYVNLAIAWENMLRWMKCFLHLEVDAGLKYMIMKPNKYGIKIFSIVDARTFFTHNLEIYVGVQPDGPFKVSNSTADVTERMCRHLSGSGRNITIDRWFTGHQVVKVLLQRHGLNVCIW